MKYLQSFYQYPVTFSSIGKTIPARSAVGEMKNIAEVSESELAKLEAKEPFFRELVSKKKLRVLNKIPESYIPAAQQINKAHEEADLLKAENEALKAKLAFFEGKNDTIIVNKNDPQPFEDDEVIDFDKADYKELQKYAKDVGIDPNQKKAVLIAELKKTVFPEATGED